MISRMLFRSVLSCVNVSRPDVDNTSLKIIRATGYYSFVISEIIVYECQCLYTLFEGECITEGSHIQIISL